MSLLRRKPKEATMRLQTTDRAETVSFKIDDEQVTIGREPTEVSEAAGSYALLRHKRLVQVVEEPSEDEEPKTRTRAKKAE